MTQKEQVEAYLKAQPLFRERKNKDDGIVNLLSKKYTEIRHLPKHIIVALVQDYASMDRAWRQALEHNEYLRGSDYEEKAKLSQEAQLRLGYEPNHDRNVKNLRLL